MAVITATAPFDDDRMELRRVKYDDGRQAITLGPLPERDGDVVYYLSIPAAQQLLNALDQIIKE